jgi:hypothetical protein
MTRDIIVSILESEGAEAKGGALAFREDRDVTCFISAPAELMAVPRVLKVELKDKFVSMLTAKDERFSFAYEDVLGFKVAAAVHAKDRSAGFGR